MAKVCSSIVKRYNAPGLSTLEPDTLTMLSCLLSSGTARLHPGPGIRDSLLLAHAMTGVVFQAHPLALMVCIQWLIGERLTPIKLDPIGGLLVVALLLCVSFWTDSCLRIESLQPIATRTSSAFLLVYAVMRLSFRVSAKAKPIAQSVHVGTNTDPMVPDRPKLSFESTEPFLMECPSYLLETPKLMQSVASPRAETTPSDFSQANWFAESLSSDLDTDPDQWFYEDLRGYVQGPFSTDMMRRWHRAGFLQDDLLVSNRGADPVSFTSIAHLKALGNPDTF